MSVSADLSQLLEMLCFLPVSYSLSGINTISFLPLGPMETISETTLIYHKLDMVKLLSNSCLTQ